MSLIVKTSSAHMLSSVDVSEVSSINITTDDGCDRWYYKNGKLTTGKFITVKPNKRTKNKHSALVVNTHWPGFYEGSIFYGCRFDDFDSVDAFLEQPNFIDDLEKADDFVAEDDIFRCHLSAVIRDHNDGRMEFDFGSTRIGDSISLVR